MDSENEEVILEVRREVRSMRTYMRYIALVLTLVACALAVAALLAWQSYSRSVGSAVEEMRLSMQEVHDMTAQTAALLEEAKQTMADVRRATGAAAPVIEEAQKTVQEVQSATAPLNLLRSIPVLNWFF